MEVKGTIKVVGTTQEVGSNGFTKRQLVVTTDDQYPQDIAIDFVKDKCAILDKYGVGQHVTVGVNLRGNEYNGKYYVNLQGWKISTAEEVPAPATEGKDDLPW